MTEAVQQLMTQIGVLSSRERAELAHFILISLEPGDDEEEVARAWEAEVARRVEEIRGGKAKGKPAEQLFAELRDEQP